MVNQEILGGLRLVLNRGESLEKAMLSFYNAGYRKEEIEEAAQFLQNPEQIQQTKQSETPNTAMKPLSKKVSYYNTENPKSNLIKKTGKWLLTAIIIAAIIFVGLLIAFLVTT